jgi:hypothetical protein
MNQLLVTLYAWHLTAVDTLRARRESGQGSLEYVAAIAVAAIIILAVVTAAKGADIGSFVNDMIQKVKDAVA